MTAPQLRLLLTRISTQRLAEGSTSLLALLHQHGSMTMGDAANELFTTSANLTGLADRLENLGFATRSFPPTDRRKVHLEITPRGVNALELILEAASPDFAR